ncbi:MAG: hypothetical protein CMO55_11355 [Verrucomicrobiales bacterium]|nr:hypothetical protein [Verrucomicrobiales bacterium]
MCAKDRISATTFTTGRTKVGAGNDRGYRICLNAPEEASMPLLCCFAFFLMAMGAFRMMPEEL